MECWRPCLPHSTAGVLFTASRRSATALPSHAAGLLSPAWVSTGLLLFTTVKPGPQGRTAVTTEPPREPVVECLDEHAISKTARHNQYGPGTLGPAVNRRWIGLSREYRVVWACTFARSEEDTWIHIPGAALVSSLSLSLIPVRSTDPSRAARPQTQVGGPNCGRFGAGGRDLRPNDRVGSPICT